MPVVHLRMYGRLHSCGGRRSTPLSIRWRHVTPCHLQPPRSGQGSPRVVPDSRFRRRRRLCSSEPRKLSLGRILRWGLMVLSLVLFVRMACTNHSEIREAIGHLFTQSGWLVAAALLMEGVWVYSLSNVYRSSIRGPGRESRSGSGPPDLDGSLLPEPDPPRRRGRWKHLRCKGHRGSRKSCPENCGLDAHLMVGLDVHSGARSGSRHCLGASRRPGRAGPPRRPGGRLRCPRCGGYRGDHLAPFPTSPCPCCPGSECARVPAGRSRRTSETGSCRR